VESVADSFKLDKQPEIALVVVNSPEHLPVFIQLFEAGIRKIGTEKPTVLTIAQLNQLISFMKFLKPACGDNDFFTAHLINFTGTAVPLMKFINLYDLIIALFILYWGQNWNPKRWMGPDLEEETPHPLAFAYTLADAVQKVTGYSVKASTTTVPHVKLEHRQEKNTLNMQYPDLMNDTTVAHYKFDSPVRPVDAAVLTSFNMFEQYRWVEISMYRRENLGKGDVPDFKAKIEFDVSFKDQLHLFGAFYDLDNLRNLIGEEKYDGWIKPEAPKLDILRIIDARTNEVLVQNIYRGNKLQDMLCAMLTALTGGPIDPRLVNLPQSIQMIRMIHSAAEQF
jgi:hypothetical protein